jgi:hypothetical protein
MKKIEAIQVDQHTMIELSNLSLVQSKPNINLSNVHVSSSG